MKHYGLIGYPLSHSFSKKYFEDKFKDLSIDASYQTFELTDLASLHSVIHKNHLDGFNVTIPHKESILKYLDSIDPIAKEIGAVNCVNVKNGKLKGYNTDIIGFKKSLLNFIPSTSNQALVFGSGGASKAVTFVLGKLHIPFLVVSRNEILNGITYNDLNESIFSKYKILINTTPVGMYPEINNCLPIPFHLINETHWGFDLIYNPEKTSFLTNLEAHGAKIKNGHEMLKIQAEESYHIFSETI